MPPRQPQPRQVFDPQDGEVRPAAGEAGEAPSWRPPEDEQWVLDLWRRLDRDGSDTITRQELESEVFHSVLRAAVAPRTGANTGGAPWARAAMNMKGAVSLCLRKADQDADGVLSYSEFRNLVLCLQRVDMAKHGTELVVALFDLNNSGSIDQREFREMLKVFMGRVPSEDEWRALWAQMAEAGQTEVTKKQCVRWLRNTTDPRFSRYTSRDCVQETDPSGWADTTGGMLFRSRSSPSRGSRPDLRDRPKWNQRFNAGLTLQHTNDVVSKGKREYFTSPQSTPELRRFYQTFHGTFGGHIKAMDAPLPPRATSAILPKCLSSEGGTPLMFPGRHSPAGKMQGHPKSSTEGAVTMWEDHWQTPAHVQKHGRPYYYPLAPRATFPALTDGGTYGAKKRCHPRPGGFHARRLGALSPGRAEFPPARETTLSP